MAIAIKLISPAGTIYDVTTGENAYCAESLPDLTLQLEDDANQVTAGDVDVTFRNTSGWYATQWATPDPEEFYDEAAGNGCWVLQIWKAGVLRWVGDLDPRSVTFDTKTAKVQASFLGKLKRLEHYNAALVRRGIPSHSDSGTGTGSLNTFAATTVDTYAANELVNHVLVDSAGTCFAITANTATSGSVTTLTVSGTPASGAYNIRPFGLLWKAATGGGYNRRVLTSKVATASLQIVPEDVIKATKLKDNGNVLQQDLEIQDTQATDGALSAYEIRLKRRLKGKYDYDTGTSCTTPYYRDLTPAALVALLFGHCGITSSYYEISLDAFTDDLVPYADFGGKNVGEALAELAAIAGAVFFATPSKYYFLGRNKSKSGVTAKDIDDLVAEESRVGLWERFYNYVTATGVKEGQYARKGGLVYPENKLDISSDYVDSVSWLQQIVERAYSLFGYRRRQFDVTVKDDGTAYEIWDEVTRTVSGVVTTFYVIAVSEPLRSVDSAARSTVTLTLLEKTGLAASTGDGETQDEAVDDSDPPPPSDLEVYKVDGTEPAMFRTLYPAADYPTHRKGAPCLISAGPPEVWGAYRRRLYCVRFKWDQDDLQGRLLGFHLKKWRGGKDPDKPTGEATWRDPEMATDGYYYWPPEPSGDDGNGGPVYTRVGKQAWYAVQAIYEDGKMSAYSDEASTTVETGDGDPDDPTAPTFTSVSSPEENLPGTPGIECGCYVTVGLTASTVKQKVRVYVTNSTTGKSWQGTAKAAYADTTAVVSVKGKFYKGDSCHVDRIEVENNGRTAALDLTAPTGNFTAGASALVAPTAPSVTGVTYIKRGAIVTVSIPADATGAVLQLYKAASGTSSNPATAPASWKKVGAWDIADEVSAGVTSLDLHVTLENAARKAWIARIRSVYSKTLFSSWSAIHDSGTIPDSDDTPPSGITLSVTSSEHDLKGTDGVECDVFFEVGWTGDATEITFEFDVSISGTTRTVSHHKTFAKAASSTKVHTFRRKAFRGDALTCRAKVRNRTSEVVASSDVAHTAGTALPSAPETPVLATEDQNKRHTVFTATWSGAGKAAYRRLHVKVKQPDGTYKQHAPINIKPFASSGTCRFTVNHKPNASVTIQAAIEDCHDQTGSYCLDYTASTTGGAGDDGQGVGLSLWLEVAGYTLATYNTTLHQLEFTSNPWGGRLDVPLHAQRCGVHFDGYLSGYTSAAFGLLDDSGNNGYYWKFTSSTSVSLYKVNGSGTASLVETYTLSTALVAEDHLPYKFEIHKRRVVCVLGPRQERFATNDTSYRTKGWKFRVWQHTTNGEDLLVTALDVKNALDFHGQVAAATVMAAQNSSSHLDARASDVTDGTNYETLNNFFEYRDSAMRLRGGKLFGDKLTAVASLPALSGVEVGDVRLVKVTGGTRRAYIVGADDSGNKEWWKIVIDDHTDTGTGAGPTVPSGDVDLPCFLLSSRLRLADGDTVALGDLAVGMSVLGVGPDGQDAPASIRDVKIHRVAYHIVLGGFLGATEEHLLYRHGRRRIPSACTRCTVGGLEIGALLWRYGSEAPYALDSKVVVSGEVMVGSIETSTRNYWIGSDDLMILAHNAKSLDI